MSEVIIVGAGLAGLTAAIHCARAGHEVQVLEKYDRVGGMPEVHPAVDGTPMRLDKISAFLEIPIGPPQVTPAEVVRLYAYGLRRELPGATLHFHAVERGTHATALETCLYNLALEAGVKFEFGWMLRSQADASQLPPGTIIATGLYIEPFEALRIPHQPVYGYIGTARHESAPFVSCWFDTYTRDYNYVACTNGVVFALGFARRPVGSSLLEKWQRQIREEEGIEFHNWAMHEGLVAGKRLDNPRLFGGNKILAGTIAGMQDPFLLFGAHSSLVSGKIAGIAVDDKAGAYDLFRRVISPYKYAWLGKQFFDRVPHGVRKPAMRAGLRLWAAHPAPLQPVMDTIMRTVPGFMTAG
jgi:hypothetical protein